MKIYNFRYIIFVFTLLITWSCKKDFLDKQPLDALSKATFWKTQEDINMALATCYASFNNDLTGQAQFGSGSAHWDGLTDNGNTPYPWEQDFTGVARGNIEAQKWGVATGMWYTCYNGIAKCNVLLDNVKNVKDIPDETLKRYMGEAIFLRSFWYNDLTQLYGDCPLLLHVLTIEESKVVKRTPKAEVVTQILKDLDEAISYLPDVSYNGHVVKASAQALKARVCLYNKMWAEAATAAKAVMDNTLFSLTPDYDYAGMFNGASQNGNKEILFSVEYLLPNIWHGIKYIHSMWFSIVPLQDLVDSYEKLPGWDPAYPYEKRDPRLKLTVYTKGDPFPYLSNPGNKFDPAKVNTTTQFALHKFITGPVIGYPQDDADIIHIRLADVMLMYAEAMFMDGKGDDLNALKAVNDVRGRFKGILPPLTRLTEDAIRHERRVELAFEGGLRFFDLRRWRIAHIVMNNLIDPVAANGKYSFANPKHYLWPIPQAEMDIMGSGFGQNPEY